MIKLLLLSAFAMTLLTQTLFSQGTLQSDADLARELYESGHLPIKELLSEERKGWQLSAV